MPYRLFSPPKYDRRHQYPLVLWLCGSAGRGDNNLNQISIGNVIGTHVWTTADNQSKHPCFVVAPQCPQNESWSEQGARPSAPLTLALELMTELRHKFTIDSSRLYVTGQSMGGFGTWTAITASAIICGSSPFVRWRRCQPGSEIETHSDLGISRCEGRSGSG